jgi:Flp pilus assembly pilin Flp
LIQEQGQTLIEYTFLIALFATLIAVSSPGVRTATTNVFNAVVEQLTSNVEIIAEKNDDGGDDGEVDENLPWIPIELNQLDENAIYSAHNVTLSGSSKIYGNVVTNGAIVTSGTSTVEGQTSEFSGHDFNFPLPVFPTISGESFQSKGSYTAGWWPPPVPIIEDGYYSSLKAINNLVIDTGNEGETRTIVVDDFELSGAGKISLSGSGKLVLVVKDQFKFTNNVLLNNGGLPENVVIYYEGEDDLEFGQGHISGSVYTKNSGISFTGSTSIQGNIFVGGGNVTVASGNVNLSDALLYAPSSDLHVTGSSGIEGRIIANSVTGSGASTIRFKPVQFDETFFWELNP